MDYFFLNKRSQTEIDIQLMSNQILSVYLTTFFLISSKFYEIDDRLVFIKDVQQYY